MLCLSAKAVDRSVDAVTGRFEIGPIPPGDYELSFLEAGTHVHRAPLALAPGEELEMSVDLPPMGRLVARFSCDGAPAGWVRAWIEDYLPEAGELSLWAAGKLGAPAGDQLVVAATRTMREVLVDQARARGSEKRGGDWRRASRACASVTRTNWALGLGCSCPIRSRSALMTVPMVA